MSQRLFMPRKPLDIKLTDYPLDKERSSQLLSLPSRRGTGVGRAHKTKSSPSKKAGANVSVILGHFQKCLTLLFLFFYTFFNRIKQVPTHRLLRCAIEAGDLPDSVK